MVLPCMHSGAHTAHVSDASPSPHRLYMELSRWNIAVWVRCVLPCTVQIWALSIVNGVGAIERCMRTTTGVEFVVRTLMSTVYFNFAYTYTYTYSGMNSSDALQMWSWKQWTRLIVRLIWRCPYLWGEVWSYEIVSFISWLKNIFQIICNYLEKLLNWMLEFLRINQNILDGTHGDTV